MTTFWVIGGEYASTDFNKIAPGKSEQRLGPFASYEDALGKWTELAWQSVDCCNVRYRIEGDRRGTSPRRVRAA